MCTVSVVPFADGFRVACNRDELRARPRALKPVICPGVITTGVWPRDPISGGTWIGVNDVGLVVALLNRAQRRVATRPAASRLLSRGTIIPELLQKPTVQAAIETASQIDASRFEPYTLVVLQRRQGFSITVNASRPTIRSHDLSRPHLFTSSSLGDDIAAYWRGKLFATLVECSTNPLAAQASFHRHRWSDRPDISVRMARADASTVSITTIDVRDQRICLRYADLRGEP